MQEVLYKWENVIQQVLDFKIVLKLQRKSNSKVNSQFQNTKEHHERDFHFFHLDSNKLS